MYLGDCGAEAAPPGSPEALASLHAQVARGLSFLRRRYRAELFFLYFQAYSSTNAPPDILAKSFDAALAALESEAPGSCRGLVVSTRPDCVDAEKAALLASYAKRGLEVWIELGLQSAIDRSLLSINRGHDVGAFVRARQLLALPGLRTAAHLILGLPGEGRKEMLSGPRLLSELAIEGVKFHDLHIPRGTPIAGDYLAGEIALLSPPSLVGLLADALELLHPDTEIIRINSEASPEERLAPLHPPDKNALYRALDAEFERRGTCQGSHRSSLDPWCTSK